MPLVRDQHKPRVAEVNLDVSDDELMAISRKGTLALTLDEMKLIRDYFKQPKVLAERRKIGLGPNPTDVELETLAQTWSEHCKHKIFNADIDYTMARTASIRSRSTASSRPTSAAPRTRS